MTLKVEYFLKPKAIFIPVGIFFIGKDEKTPQNGIFALRVSGNRKINPCL